MNTTLLQGGALSAIFRVSWYVIKKQRQLLIIGALLLWVLNLGFQRGLEKAVGPDLAQEFQTKGQNISPGLIEQTDRSAIVPYLPLLVIGLILMIIIFVLVTVTITLKVFHTVEAKELALQETIQHARKKVWPYIWTSIVQGVCLFGLFLLFIIPGIIFAVYWYFTLYVVLYHDKKGDDALHESKKIVQHRRRNTLGTMILIGIIVVVGIMIISGVVGALVGLLGNSMMSEAFTQLIGYVMQLVMIVVMSVFFLRRDKTRIHTQQTAQ